MRILVVSNVFPPVVRGGYELDCAGVVERLREGHDVTVLTSSLDRGKVGGAPWIRRELPFVAYSRADSARAPLHALRGAKVAQRALDEVDPELIYVWNAAQVPHSALAVLARSGRPLAFRIMEHWFGRLWGADVFMRHLEPGERGARGVWARAMRAVNRHPALRLDHRARHPVAVAWVSDALRRISPAPPAFEPVLERVLFPVTPNQERFRGVERRPAAEPTVLFAGRLEPEKGPDVVVRALAQLPPAVRGVFAGAGDPEVVLGPARELGIAERIELTGPLAPDALAERMATAHVFVIPSVWEEPLPLLCFEGALTGVPIVASRVGGIPELFEHEEHALLFPPGDAGACAEALARTLADDEGRAARARARVDEFTVAGYLTEQERFLEEALARLPATPAARPSGPRSAG